MNRDIPKFLIEVFWFIDLPIFVGEVSLFHGLLGWGNSSRTLGCQLTLIETVNLTSHLGDLSIGVDWDLFKRSISLIERTVNWCWLIQTGPIPLSLGGTRQLRLDWDDQSSLSIGRDPSIEGWLIDWGRQSHLSFERTLQLKLDWGRQSIKLSFKS